MSKIKQIEQYIYIYIFNLIIFDTPHLKQICGTLSQYQIVIKTKKVFCLLYQPN